MEKVKKVEKVEKAENSEPIVIGWKFSEWKFDYEYTNNQKSDKVFRYLCVIEKENKCNNEDTSPSVLIAYLMNPSYACEDHLDNKGPVTSDKTVNGILKDINAKKLSYNKVIIFNSCPFKTSTNHGLTKDILNHKNVIKNYETIMDYIFALEEDFDLLVATGNKPLKDKDTLTYECYIKTMNAFENNKLRKQTFLAGINDSYLSRHASRLEGNKIFNLKKHWLIKTKQFN